MSSSNADNCQVVNLHAEGVFEMRLIGSIVRSVFPVGVLPFLCIPMACSAIVDSDIKPSGIGEACLTNDDCHASTCENGICASKCSLDTDCPEPSKCAEGLCQNPLKVVGLWVGVIAGGEGWTTTHQIGMDSAPTDAYPKGGAVQQLPYLNYSFKEGLLGESFAQAIDEAVANKVEVIIGNSFSHQPEMTAKAEQYPDTKFLIASGYPNTVNLGAYWGYLEQAWCVAGKVAAQKSKKNRLGYLVPFITSEIMRHGNVFLRCAQTVKPDITLEVRYMGFWYDYNSAPTFQYKPEFLHLEEDEPPLDLYAEEYLTAKFIDSGCDVIAHGADNQRPVRFVQKYIDSGDISEVYTFGNDNQYAWKDAQGNPIPSCLGSPYWNWTPLYVRLLDEIHRKTWKPGFVIDPLTEDPEQRVCSFEPNESAGVDGTSVKTLLNEETRRGWQALYEGPFETTGQRAPMPAGQTIDEAEWRGMCYWLKGVVQRSNPQDPTSEDIAALVPDDGVEGSMPVDPAVVHPTTAPEIILSYQGVPPELRNIAWPCTQNSTGK